MNEDKHKNFKTFHYYEIKKLLSYLKPPHENTISEKDEKEFSWPIRSSKKVEKQ